MTLQPETHYARSGDVHIAFQVVGDGALDLVWIPSLAHHVELSWENPVVARFLDRLAMLGRLIVFDKRGTGMSDRVSSDTTLETRMDDIRAVMDAAGSDRAVVCGLGEGSPLGMLFAATYPERTSGLILIHATPRLVRSSEFPWLRTRADFDQVIGEAAGHLGTVEKLVRAGNPDMNDEDAAAFARTIRLSVSPGAFREYMRMSLDVDVCSILPTIRVPTLILHRKDVPQVDVRSGRYLADRIPGARLVVLEGRNFAPSVGDQEALLREVTRFLDELESGEWKAPPSDRVLSTVLFTDIVGSTALAAELGDSAWRDLLNSHHELIRRELARHRGTEVDTAGDGFFASFDGPARAIRCGCVVVEAVRELGIEVRAGLHTGECELVDGKVGGIAVHIGARIASQAAPGEVLVSSTVKDLVAGSGITFAERGPAELQGIPGEWRLFAVEQGAA
jgi:class 3 adenylate cyclase/alpha-beta hydrolase superfamily lysophospholipase